MSVDPLQFEYPHYTPYQYAGNKPIIAIDIDGLKPFMPDSAMAPKTQSDCSNIKVPYRIDPGTIDFIDESTGKYLGSYTSLNLTGYEIHSIAYH